MITKLLALSLVVLLVLSFLSSDQEIASPLVAFFAPFSLAAIDLIYNIEKWNVELQWNTYYAMIGGSLCLFMTVLAIRLLSKSKEIRSNQYKEVSPSRTTQGSELRYIDIPRFNTILFLVFQMVAFILCLRAVTSISRRYGISGDLSTMIAGYKELKTFTTEDISLGKINNFLYDFCYSAGYVWFYVVTNNFIVKKKLDVFPFLNLVMSIAVAMEKGSRGGAIGLLCSGAAMIIIFWIKNSKIKKLSIKQILSIAAVALIVIGSFQKVGELLGRTSSADFGGYLSVYLSAPIRNFDYYMQQFHSTPDVWGKMSFVRMINYLGGKLHIANWVYELDLPPLRANGYVTGNVYTTFYAYIYDFGYIGIPIMMILMGIISQSLYAKAMQPTSQGSKFNINIWVLLYSNIFYMLAFSFFSNKFYEGVMSIQFYKYILFWFMIRYFLEKVRYR